MSMNNPLVVPMTVVENTTAVTLRVAQPEDISMTVTGVVYIDYPEYEGETEVTPGAEAHTLETNGTLLRSNITINPIPSNYGLVAWDGSVLTVS